MKLFLVIMTGVLFGFLGVHYAVDSYLLFTRTHVPEMGTIIYIIVILFLSLYAFYSTPSKAQRAGAFFTGAFFSAIIAILAMSSVNSSKQYASAPDTKDDIRQKVELIANKDEVREYGFWLYTVILIGVGIFFMVRDDKASTS